jgi:hypothetical protein
MTEAAWNAVRTHPYWKAQFERFVQGKHLHPKAAAVALARQLLTVVWHVLTKREADRLALPTQVGKKFLLWSYRVGRKQRAAGTSAAFVRAELTRVGLPIPSSLQWGGQTVNLTPTGT